MTFTLTYDSSASSTALRLYLSIVKNKLDTPVELQQGENKDEVYPQLKINNETTLLGATTIAQYIDRLTSSSIVSRSTALESCQVSSVTHDS
jgi:rRNA maturation protein Rpf1